jgi:hypothetical protein
MVEFRAARPLNGWTKKIELDAAHLARHLAEDGIDPALARSLANILATRSSRAVAAKDQVESVVTREVQGLRVEMIQQLRSPRVELSDKLTIQFRWLLGWLAIGTVGILLDLVR